VDERLAQLRAFLLEPGSAARWRRLEAAREAVPPLALRGERVLALSCAVEIMQAEHELLPLGLNTKLATYRVYRALRRSLDAREQALCVADARLQSALATINLELLSSMSDGEFFAAPEAEAVEAGEDDEEEVD